MGNIETLYVTQGSGNSFKPALVAHQLKKRLNYHYVDVLAGETRQSPFIDINPLGQVPFLALPNGTGLAESNAIAWYLAEASALIPDSALSRAQAIRWMNFEQTALEANISPVRFFTHIAPELGSDQQDMLPIWRDRGARGLSVLNDYLGQNDYVTDYGYSVADIAVYGYTHLADEGGFSLSDYPAIIAWIDRVKQQENYLEIDNLLTMGKEHRAA